MALQSHCDPAPKMLGSLPLREGENTLLLRVLDE